MTPIVILYLIGVAFLAMEVFVPGAILGIIGGIAIFCGVVVAFVQFGAVGGAIAFVAAIALVVLTLYLEFVVLPKTRIARSLTMSGTAGSTSQPPPAREEDVMEKVGEAVTALAPTGYVKIGGRRYEAFSRSGFLKAGESVRVTGVDNFKLIVTQNTRTT